MRLENKVVIVTGAGQGIGEAIARRFASEGARVLVADIDAASAKAVTKAIRDAGGEAVAAVSDISREEGAKALADAALDHFSRIDILVNNAANFVHKRVEDATAEDWHAVLGVNVLGTSFCSKYAVAAMKNAGGGSIVNIASINGLVAMPEWMTYNASKAAIIEMSKSMALDLAPFDIRVNCVCPGMTMTPSLRRALPCLRRSFLRHRRHACDRRRLHRLAAQGDTRGHGVLTGPSCLAPESSGLARRLRLVLRRGRPA